MAKMSGNAIFKEQQNELSKEMINEDIKSFDEKIIISIIMPLYNPTVAALEKAIESLQNQFYTEWELCAVDDGSVDKRGINYLKSVIDSDSRIKLFEKEKNEGISITSNKCLELANGKYVALMDQDDELTKDALYWIAKEINCNPSADWIYTDECKTDENTEKFFDYYFKPDWSPELLLTHMYTGHLSVYRTSLVRSVGGFRKEYDFSQDYDLALRMSEATTNIVHIERILYLWRALETSGAAGGKDFARETNLLALSDWYKRHNIDGYAMKNGLANSFAVKRTGEPTVSIVIPSDSFANLKNCIEKIIQVSSYKNIEIIPVANSKTCNQVNDFFAYCREIIKCAPYDKMYNFSDKCNRGAETASGKFVIFYNDDVVPFSVDWIERLLDVIVIEGVGGVSPMLLHEDYTVQYAGMITGTPGMAGTSFNGRKIQNIDSPIFHHLLMRNVSILCGACMIMDKEYFMSIGGFDSVNTPNGHSDVDLSFKIMESGKRCVYTPYSSLIHVGNHSWHEPRRQDKSDIFCLKKWSKYLTRDKYFTDSMKKVFYNDIPYDYKIYNPYEKMVETNGKDILLVFHELSLSGVPIVMMDMVKLLKKQGCFVVVLSLRDGKLRGKLLESGVQVIIAGDEYEHSNDIRRFAYNFDLVIAGSLAVGNTVRNLGNIYPNIIWWCHEGNMAYEVFKDRCPLILPDNVYMYYGGQYAQRCVEKHFNKSGEVLLYGVNDRASGNVIKEIDNYKKILFVGAIEKRKGLDVFIDSLYKISKKELAKIKIDIIGLYKDMDIKTKIEKAIRDLTCQINVYLEMDREELYNYYLNADCLIIPSRDDPMPVVATEACMLNTVIISSDNVGTADFIKDGENGFVFKSEDAEDLAKRLTTFINLDSEQLLNMKMKSRLIYEENFKMDVFEKNAKAIISKLIK